MNDWIEWEYTEEKPYPETLDTCVDVRFRDGVENHNGFTVDHWHNGIFDSENDPSASSWHQDGNSAEIVAYRVVP